MLNNKIILVTGGTGSLGHVLTRKILSNYTPNKLIIFSRDELKQSQMAQEFSNYDNIRFFLGDIRDKNRLLYLFDGVDFVIHAAALKQIPALEYNPTEGIKTNVIGSMNVVEAAMEREVKRAVLISTDKACVDRHARVTLSNGSNLSIRDIVKNKLPVEVKTLTDRGIGKAKVVGWHKNKLDGRKMIKVGYEGIFKHHGVRKGALVTEDHPILTTNGWVPAGQLTEKDFLITSECSPNDKQAALLCGAMLGDSSITKAERPAMNFGHSLKQKEWLQLKHQALSSLGVGKIKESNKSNRKCGYNFRLASTAFLRPWRQEFYHNGKKVVSKNLFLKYLSPLLLAAWYLDDGCYTHKNARFATHGFSFKDVAWLVEALKNYDIESYLYKAKVDGKYYPELRLTVSGTKKLFDYIGSLVPPTLRYKIADDAKAFDKNAWDLGRPAQYVARATIEKLADLPREPAVTLPSENKGKELCKRGHKLNGKNSRIIPQTGSRQCLKCVKIRNEYRRKNNHYAKGDVYCLDVEGTHNFVVNGVILHNCAPLTLYGATKLAAEKLFLAANSYNKTDFLAVRYGNVLASRGSVIEFFLKLKEKGEKFFPITDRRMTRFWITLEQAAELVLIALERGQRESVLVPKLPTMSITQVARAIEPECIFKSIGIRGSEKIHETLITEGEKNIFLVDLESKAIISYNSDKCYTSNKNNFWLSKSDFRKLIEKDRK